MGIQRIEFDHPLECRDGSVQLPCLPLRDPKQTQRVGIAGL